MVEIQTIRNLNKKAVNLVLAKISSDYIADAERIGERLRQLHEQIKQRPDPDTLTDLEFRCSILAQERRDLIKTAYKLAQLAAPPARHPSILHRGA